MTTRHKQSLRRRARPAQEVIVIDENHDVDEFESRGKRGKLAVAKKDAKELSLGGNHHISSKQKELFIQNGPSLQSPIPSSSKFKSPVVTPSTREHDSSFTEGNVRRFLSIRYNRPIALLFWTMFQRR